MSDYISKSEMIHKIRGVVPSSQDVDFIVRLIEEQPTLDEKEIIRKPFERVVERLEKESETADNELKRTIERNPMQTDFALGYKMAIKNAIGIVQKECGISE